MFAMTVVVGRVGRDPESRTTTSGKKVVSFSVATDTFSGGERGTEWYRCVGWDKTAEIVEKHVKKGDIIVVQGRMQTRTYEKDGIEKSSTELVADRVSFVPTGKKPGSEGGSTEEAGW